MYSIKVCRRNEVEEFNFRRPKEEPMTLTRLKAACVSHSRRVQDRPFVMSSQDNRLKDKAACGQTVCSASNSYVLRDSGQIEYDMNHFSFPRSFPRECPARLKFRNLPMLMTFLHADDTCYRSDHAHASAGTRSTLTIPTFPSGLGSEYSARSQKSLY